MAWTKEAREKAALSKKIYGATNQYTKAKKERLPIPDGANKGKPGTFIGRTHTEESKRKMSDRALASTHRRLKRKMIEYKGVMLDSTWELALAKLLDENNIKWFRPKPLKWFDDENKERNYFPDFYLPEYNLYIDPKNSHAYNGQKNKIEKLKEQCPNIVFVRSMKEINEFALMVKQDITRVF